MFGDTAVEGGFMGLEVNFKYARTVSFKNFYSDAPVFYGIDSHEKRAFCDSTSTRKFSNERAEMRTDVTDWKGKAKEAQYQFTKVRYYSSN